MTHPSSDSTTRLHFLHPRPLARDGLASLPTDLRAFFALIPRVGPKAALLLLTLKAFRQRSAREPHSTVGLVTLDELRWVLRASRRALRWRLQRLSRHGFLVYQTQPGPRRETILIEFVPVSPPAVALDATPAPSLDLPTIYFLHVLPRIGPFPFLTYLYLLSCEPIPLGPAGFALSGLAESLLCFWGRPQAWVAIQWLRWFGLVARHPRDGGLIVRDPKPLTRVQRWVLTQRERGRWPRTRGHWVAGFVLLAALWLVLVMLH